MHNSYILGYFKGTLNSPSRDYSNQPISLGATGSPVVAIGVHPAKKRGISPGPQNRLFEALHPLTEAHPLQVEKWKLTF